MHLRGLSKSSGKKKAMSISLDCGDRICSGNCHGTKKQGTRTRIVSFGMRTEKIGFAHCTWSMNQEV